MPPQDLLCDVLQYHRMLINARKVREIIDYDIQEEIVESAATLKLEDGKEFVAAIKEIIAKG